MRMTSNLVIEGGVWVNRVRSEGEDVGATVRQPRRQLSDAQQPEYPSKTWLDQLVPSSNQHTPHTHTHTHLVPNISWLSLSLLRSARMAYGGVVYSFTCVGVGVCVGRCMK